MEEKITNNEKTLIKALVKEIRKNKLLKEKITLYGAFLTDSQKRNADAYINELAKKRGLKEGDQNDPA